MEAIKIVLFATAAAIVYGVLHDLVTAHLCVEYFTVAHPPVFPTRSPILLALGWGVIASWWVGLILGVGLATAARAGRSPELGLAELRRPVVGLMFATAVVAILSGALGAGLEAAGIVSLPDEWATAIPPGKQVAFAADAWTHAASYGFGALGGLFVIGGTIRRRLRAGRKAADIVE